MRTTLCVATAAILICVAGCGSDPANPAPDVALIDATDTQTDIATDTSPDRSPRGPDTVDTVDPATLPPIPEGPSIEMSLRTDPPLLPFPWDWHSVVAAEAATGLRLKVTGALHANALIQPVANMFAAYLPHLELLNGFGPVGIVTLPVTEAPAGLPAYTGAGEAIEVRRISDGADVLFRIEYVEYLESGEVARRLIELDPVRPLHEGERYLVLVRQGLSTAAGGDPFLRPPLAEVTLGLRAPYGPASWCAEMARIRDHTLDALDAVADSPAPEELLLALLYTTGTSKETMFTAADMIQAMDVEVDLDPDGDGVDNITPGPDHSSFASHPQVGLVVEGRFAAPDFRDADGILLPGPDGQPEVHDYTWRDFWLVVPSEPTDGPWPFAIAQHGLNSYKETMHSWAREYASLGIASGGFDFMYHEKGKDGGFWFLALDVPRVLMDNFRQSALDILSFERAVRGLDLDLDLDRIAYTGHSLGAIMSSLACPLSRTERVGGFVNGGGDFIHLIQTSFEKMGLYDALPGGTWSAFRILGSHMISFSDPAHYARHLMLDPVGGRGPCPFQLHVSLHDTTVPPRTGYELAVAAGAPLVEPVLEDWDWLTPTPPEGLTWGVLQFDGEHELFNGGDGSEQKARARGVFFHYVDSFLHGGEPEIVWPEP